MISFKTYFLTEDINKVPRNELGMFTSMVDLPDNPPYGFWIDRSGNFVPVKYEQHINVLDNIMKKYTKWCEKNGVEPMKSKSRYGYAYADLKDLGWARIVVLSEYIYYDLAEGHQLTQSQKKFLNFASEMYDKKGIMDSN